LLLTQAVVPQIVARKVIKRSKSSIGLLKYYECCRLCPRQCGINRISDSGQRRVGPCGETHQLRAAYAGPHFGEEPPITGKNGSGTVFFTGCPLKCAFCQNYQISHQGVGAFVELEALKKRLEDMIRINHVHNINFVTPDHFFPHVFFLVSLLRFQGLDLPIVYNLSGFQSLEMLKIAEDYADIYLPDFKYSDPSLSARLSRCADYPKVALGAIAEMVRQKGFLDICSTGPGLARKGVLVRHLILPGNVKNSIDAVTLLFAEFGRDLPLSLMSQYYPVIELEDRELNLCISEDEFYRVYSQVMELGFEHIFVQFPRQDNGNQPKTSPFLPDFRLEEPFG